jgi:hypothetical protein
VAELLLESGAHMDATAEMQITPLHVASVAGQTEVVHLLLDHGASIDLRSAPQAQVLSRVAPKRFPPVSLSAIGFAAVGGHKDTVAVLLGRGAQAEPALLARRLQHHAVGSGGEILFPSTCCRCATQHGTTSLPVSLTETQSQAGIAARPTYSFSLPICGQFSALLANNGKLLARLTAGCGVVGLAIGAIVAITTEWLAVFVGGMLGVIVGYVFYALAAEPSPVKVEFESIVFRNKNYQAQFDAVELSDILASGTRTPTNPGNTT